MSKMLPQILKQKETFTYVTDLHDNRSSANFPTVVQRSVPKHLRNWISVTTLEQDIRKRVASTNDNCN